MQTPEHCSQDVTGSVPRLDGISVDVEDYFQVEAFSASVSRSDWPSFESRVWRNTERVLELFSAQGCKATFFILGWIAERAPELVRTIAEQGHELGCHSYAHQRIFQLTPQQFREDLRRSRGAIEDASGCRVFGYRAPTFSIVRKSLWALEILANEGFAYDSSIFPVQHDLYGFPDAPRWIHKRELSSGASIIEIPMSTIRIAGINLPAGGGGYLRILPLTYTMWAINRLHRKEGQPAIVYFHPWELDPNQPRIQAPWKSRLRHYTNLQHMRGRLTRLLQRYQFAPLIQLVEEHHEFGPAAGLRERVPSAGGV